LLLYGAVNKLRVGSEKKSGGSGRHRRAKPEEAGTRGSSVKEGFLGGVWRFLFGTHALPLLNLLTVIIKRINGKLPAIYAALLKT
jgi:hypothetical protein